MRATNDPIDDPVPTSAVGAAPSVAVRVRVQPPRSRDERLAAGSDDVVGMLRGITADGSGVFSLVAAGGAMRDALVNDGDVVVLQIDRCIADGELAAVRPRAGGAPMLRRLYFEGDRVRLQPENRRIEATVVERDNLKILGRVIAVARHDPCRTGTTPRACRPTAVAAS